VQVGTIDIRELRGELSDPAWRPGVHARTSRQHSDVAQTARKRGPSEPTADARPLMAENERQVLDLPFAVVVALRDCAR
jgi:hypothetical protein